MLSRDAVIVKNPKILGGTPVFRGTRVPFQALLDYLEGGHFQSRLSHRAGGRTSGQRERRATSIAEERGFQVLVTVDKEFEYERNLRDAPSRFSFFTPSPIRSMIFYLWCPPV